MREMLRNVPPELQEAFRLMQVAKSTGDEKAQKRAEELALLAVERGGPETKQKFLAEVRRQMPEAEAPLAEKVGVKVKPQERDFKSGAVHLEEQMRKGQEEMRRQMDDLQKHQEQLERLKTPEDFFKFMHEGGMDAGDIQRMFAGDEAHTQACMQKMLEKVQKPQDDVKKRTEEALKVADEIHNVFRGVKGEELEDRAEPEAEAAPAVAEEPQAQIPEHRVQYRKDASGRYEAVELRVELPGVADMGLVSLDVNERHLRLATCAPAPLFVVNVGPFPVLVDASAARAKFSKKRQELTVTVPAADAP